MFFFVITVVVFIAPSLTAATCNLTTDVPHVTGYFEAAPYKPAFSSVMPNQDQSNYYLGFSSFNSLRVPDSVLKVAAGITGDLTSGDSPDSLVSESTNWPNEVNLVPSEVFQGVYAWSIAAGFFINNAQDGGLYVVDMADFDQPGETVKISSRKEGDLWYYHVVEWMDMNKDGHLDAVTARAYGMGEKSQLVWFENPGFPEITGNWTGHVLNNGTLDVAFCLADFPDGKGGTTAVVIGAGFWGQKLSITWSNTDDWTDLDSIQQIIIDGIGFYFDVEYTDVNNDGKKDILTTTWSQQGFPGLLVAYEMPENWKTDPWPSHILEDGFKEFNQNGKGSPGAARTFHPRAWEAQWKPYIMVSGDDDPAAFIAFPNSQDPNDWTYTTETIYRPEGETVIGAISMQDVNYDGYMDIFLPSYSLHQVVAMSYAP